MPEYEVAALSIKTGPLVLPGGRVLRKVTSRRGDPGRPDNARGPARAEDHAHPRASRRAGRHRAQNQVQHRVRQVPDAAPEAATGAEAQAATQSAAGGTNLSLEAFVASGDLPRVFSAG